MSFEEESRPTLKELVTEALQSNGTLENIQAQLRASVFHTLEEDFKEKNIPLVNKRAQHLLSSPVGKIAVGLVKDFLECLELDFTMSVFGPESSLTSIADIPDHAALLDIVSNSSEQSQSDSKKPALLSWIESTSQGLVTEQRNHCENIKKTVPEHVSDTIQSQLPIETLELITTKDGPPSSTSEPTSKLEINIKEAEPKSIHEPPADQCTSPIDLSEHKSTLSGSNNGYLDEFASSTEEEESNKEDDSEKNTEDIEEDFSLNDIISTQSEASESTKDCTVSENIASSAVDHQESL